jgi:hypothetical protein
MNTNPSAAAKSSIALRLARTRAIMDVLQITPGPHQVDCLEGERLYEHVEELYDQYFAQHALDRPENEERKGVFLQAIMQAEMHRGTFIIYHPNHKTYWQNKIENTPLHLIGSRIDKDIALLNLEMERHYGVTSFHAQDARYLLRILQERIHELNQEGLLHEYLHIIRRLEAGIVELQEKERTLHFDQASSGVVQNEVQQDRSTDGQPLLTLRQIALLHIYQNKPSIKGIKRAREIAVEYGFTSGERLYTLFNQVRTIKDRINVEGRQVDHLIRAIEAVLPYLSEGQKKQANSELVTLRLKSRKLV